MEDFLFKNFWIVLMAITLVNGFLLKIRFNKYISEHPELIDGYNKIIKVWLIFGSFPWVIIMIGSLTGLTQNISEYFNPMAMNPMVLVFHFIMISVWLIAAVWIFFRGGAEFIASHPGVIRTSILNNGAANSAISIKIFFSIILIVTLTIMAIVWSGALSIPVG